MHHGEMTDWRWASFSNAAGEIVPAYALVRAYRGATNEYDGYKPNADSLDGLFVNGEVDVPVITAGTTPGGGNMREPFLPTQILYNPADGRPLRGDIWGASKDEWWLRRNRKQEGFRCLSDGDGTKVWAIFVCKDPNPCGCGPTTTPCDGSKLVGPPCVKVTVQDSYGNIGTGFMSNQPWPPPPAIPIPGLLNYSGWATQSGKPDNIGEGSVSCTFYVVIDPNTKQPTCTVKQTIDCDLQIPIVLGKYCVFEYEEATQDDYVWDGVSCAPIIPMGQNPRAARFLSICPATEAECAFFTGGGALGGPIKLDSSCGCSDPSCNCGSLPGVAPAPTLSVAYVDKLLTAKPTPLFENFADVGNVLGGEDTLYSHDLDANELRFNGDSIQTEVTFLIAAGASATPRVYFAGIKIYDPGVVAAGVAEKAISLRVRVTRATSATARATVTMTPDLSGTQYTPEGTLTGINFGAKITVLVTGAGTATNDIKAVQSSTTKTPSSTTLAGVLPMEILGRGPANAIAVPFSAADYSGAGASLLHTGSASGTSDVDVWVTPTATVTKGQLIRVFKEAGGVKQLVVAYELKARTADANNPDWQKAERAARVPITGVGEKIFVSKENNEGVIARSEPQNYFVG